MKNNNMSTEAEIKYQPDKPSYCAACGDQLRRFSMLICPDCLEEKCCDFSKLAESIDLELSDG